MVPAQAALSYNHTMSANNAHDPLYDKAPAPGLGPDLFALLRVTAGFLTRLPIPAGNSDEGLPADALARSMTVFPLVGAGVGILGSIVLLLCGWLAVPAAVAAVAALGALVWLTGALHEDGLADLADGFGGGADREAKLGIMRDSRIGSYGVLALIVTFALKALALAAVANSSPWLAAAILVAASAWSRALFAPLMRWLPPARADGIGAGAGTPTATCAWQGLVVGAGVALLVTISGAGGAALIALATGGLAAFLVGWLALDHVGGYTGDVLGAAQQAAETATLVVFSAILTGASM